MKKIVIALIAAYIGFFAIQIYQKNEFNKKQGDEKWQYFKKVIFDKDIDKMAINPNDSLLRWDSDIYLKIDGHPSIEDVKSIKAIVSQLNILIAPKKIQFTNESSQALTLTFLNKSEIEIFTHDWPQNAFSRSSIGGVIVFRKGEIKTKVIRKGEIKTKVIAAGQVIRIDSTTQVQRNNHIVKGMVNLVLGLGVPTKKMTRQQNGSFDCYGNYISGGGPNLDSVLTKYCFFDIYGNNLNQFKYDRYKNSIFNSSCKNCAELTDIDKYIVKTFYSNKLDEIIAKHNLTWRNKNFKTFYFILIALCAALILLLYYSGFVKRTIFLTIDSKLKNNWISFNCKIISVYLLFVTVWISTSLLDSYIWTTTDKLLFPLGFHTFITLMAETIFVWLVYVLASLNIIYLIEKVWLTRSEQFAKQQLFSFIVFVISILFTKYLLDHVVFKIYFYFAPLYVGAALGIVRFLYNYSNYQKKLAVIDKEQEIKTLRELKTRAELNALQSKINPHFLYNALNSIAGLAHENADKVEQMAIALSKLFRYSINKEDSDFTTVQNEVEMVAIYLEIEKVRFEDRLVYSIEVKEDAKDKKIPRFIIQSLVENAIKHGIANVTEKATLNLAISLVKNKLLVKVSDNGSAFPEDLITGFGLNGIYEKLDILYPNRYVIKMQNGANKNISILLDMPEK